MDDVSHARARDALVRELQALHAGRDDELPAMVDERDLLDVVGLAVTLGYMVGDDGAEFEPAVYVDLAGLPAAEGEASGAVYRFVLRGAAASRLFGGLGRAVDWLDGVGHEDGEYQP